MQAIRFSGTVATRNPQVAASLRQIQAENNVGRVFEENGATFYIFDKHNNLDVQSAVADKRLPERQYYYSPFKLTLEERAVYAAGGNPEGDRR